MLFTIRRFNDSNLEYGESFHQFGGLIFVKQDIGSEMSKSYLFSLDRRIPRQLRK